MTNSARLQLLLMRHAKSDWSDGGISDFDRPLNARGVRDAPRMAGEVLRRGLLPDLLLVSAARRAFMTGELVMQSWREALDAGGASSTLVLPQVTVLRELYHSGPETVLECIAAARAPHQRRIMVIAHNPGLEETVEHLCYAESRMPTAAIAVLESDEPITPGESELLLVLTPKEL